jgi:excisionase family DNA binding protein
VHRAGARVQMNTPPLLTKRDVAQHLAVSPRTVQRYIATGALRPVRIGNVVRFEQTELSAFVRAMRGAR